MKGIIYKYESGGEYNRKISEVDLFCIVQVL